MEVFTLKEWEDNFDELFSRVENGETIGIVREDGQAAVMMPADEADLYEYTQKKTTTLIDVFGNVANWLMPLLITE